MPGIACFDLSINMFELRYGTRLSHLKTGFFFKKNNFNDVYISVLLCGFVNSSTGAQRGQKMALDPLEPELWGGRTKVPDTSVESKLGSSARVVRVINF